VFWESALTGLRERQKEDRRNRILAAAREMFARSGYENATIEAIAELAEVSGVTVHNYYGTKSGVLLALVAESDRVLLEKIANELPDTLDGLIELMLEFSAIIRRHARSYLSRALWRQVIAASVIEANSRFGKSYHALDHQLSLALTDQIEKLQDEGKVAPEVSAYDLGKALFNLQNARFIQFISWDGTSDEDVYTHLRDYINALLHASLRS